MTNATDKIILWSDIRFCSPWVLTVWTMLKEKGVSFEMRTVDYRKDEHLSKDFLCKNPFGKIPILEDGDQTITESVAILEYIEERFPAPAYVSLFPSDVVGRAKDRAILSWLRSDLFALRECMPYEAIFLKMPTPKFSNTAIEEAKDLIQCARSRLKNSHSATIADFELACTLRRLIYHGYDLSDFPDVVAYSEKIWNRPSIQSWVEQDRREFLS